MSRREGICGKRNDTHVEVERVESKPLSHFSKRNQIKVDAGFGPANENEGVRTPPKQEQNTAAGEPSDSSVTSPLLSNEHPQSDQTTAAAENSSPTINAGGGIDRSPPSDPLCRICGRVEAAHFPGTGRMHPFDNTRERRKAQERK